MGIWAVVYGFDLRDDFFWQCMGVCLGEPGCSPNEDLFAIGYGPDTTAGYLFKTGCLGYGKVGFMSNLHNRTGDGVFAVLLC